ncbi:MAG: copper amine oxidase N-terminal domain-containing protein [Clostridia bacterium]|nr:copper amine oxidase N-terminal domain-containing protein [Clostridia bacterium]
MPKKLISAILCTVIILSSIVAFASDITITYNDTPLVLDTGAYCKNNRTMVPLRGVFEAVGATVGWDNETQTAMIVKENGTNIDFIFLQIGQAVAYVNSEQKALEVPAEITNGRTMVPLHFVIEELGAKVEWEKETNTVKITDK